MPELRFRVDSRIREFWRNLKAIQLESKKSLIYFLGWIISFIIILFPVRFIFELHNLFYIVHVYFWFKLVDYIHKRIRPPNEVLIALFFLFYLLELAFLRSFYAAPTSFTFVIQTPGSLFKFFQIIVLSFLILIFSVILVQNCQGKKRVLITYIMLGIIGINLLEYEGFIYLLFLQIILFIFLLRRTTWLVELTKIECWIYLVIVFYAYRWFSELNLFHMIEADQVRQMLTWFTLPQFLYLLFKMYLLAVLVKLPIVLIYNFARLSRKLKISSLFQSTFPQFIQLCMLVLIFYFFIAGWQADKVREALTNQIEQITAGEVPASINLLKVADDESDRVLQLKGYEPVRLFRQLPEEGILSVPKKKPEALSNASEVDFFLFFKSLESGVDYIYFARLDSNFLQWISQKTSILAGSHLLAYPYKPPNWEAYLYELINWRGNQNIRIFPFGLTPQRKTYILSVPFKVNKESSGDWDEEINFRIAGQNQFTVGRVIAPLIDANMEHTGFFAFDILLMPDVSFFKSSMLSYILLLAFIYFLVNLLVIRRMVKFGSEINRVIVQKFNQLKSGIREISTGNLDYKVRLEGEDEFVELADRFNQMGDKLKASIAEAREKERLEHELKIARQVQLSLLPLDLPKVPGYQIAATLKTANEVGGDFYDVLSLDKNRYLFTIGDVSGKGTSAAFYMAQCLSIIRSSHQFTDEPGEIVVRLNKYFAYPLIDREIFVTAVVGVLDLKKSSLRFVRAGHTPPILLPGNMQESIHELESNGLGIGLERIGNIFEQQLEVVDVPVRSGDMIIFYTDGVVEAARSNGSTNSGDDIELQFYGKERYMNLLNELRGKNASDILQALKDDLEAFYGEKSPVDDYTLLIIQKTGA